jgi:hypothetical protein
MSREVSLPALPKRWDDLSKEQMVRLNELRRSKGSSVALFRFHALCYLLSIERTGSMQLGDGGTVYHGFVRTEKGQPVGEEFFLSDEDVFQINEAHLKWVLEDSDRLMDVFPKIQLEGKDFTSPGYAMSGMTYQQFQFAQRYMQAYHQVTSSLYKRVQNDPNFTEKEAQPLIERREEMRCRFLAAVFTPAVSVGSKTVDGKLVVYDPPVVGYVFSTSQIETYAHCFHQFSEDESDAVFQHFSGVMKYYKKLFPLLFKEGDGGESDMIQAEQGTMNALQDKLRFANYQTIYDSNAPFILGKLHAIIKEAKDIENANLRMKSRSR